LISPSGMSTPTMLAAGARSTSSASLVAMCAVPNEPASSSTPPSRPCTRRLQAPARRALSPAAEPAPPGRRDPGVDGVPGPADPREG
jgi:hypothetical protein